MKEERNYIIRYPKPKDAFMFHRLLKRETQPMSSLSYFTCQLFLWVIFLFLFHVGTANDIVIDRQLMELVGFFPKLVRLG